MRTFGNACMAIVLMTACSGCGETKVSRVGLLSIGDLEARTIPPTVDGPLLVGKDACEIGGDPYYLSEAVRNALKGTEFDTLIDADITTTTGLLVWSNAIEVKGTGVNSKTFPKDGGAK